MFVAIIALAAAPQALQDARRLANAAQQRAVDEFWSVFLSYNVPDANSPGTGGATELVADGGASATQSCPLERVVESAGRVTLISRGSAKSSLPKAAQAGRRASAKAQPSSSETAEVSFDAEEIASLDAVRRVEVQEKEKSATSVSSLHARETERLAEATNRAALASFVDADEDLQVKIKQAMEMDKALRQRSRYNRSEPGQGAPRPNPIRNM